MAEYNALLMYDSVGCNWPSSAQYILYYVDGQYANYTAAKAKSPNATFVGISVTGTPDTACYDIEPGCIWPPATAAQVLAGEIVAGRRPTAYMSLDNWAGVEAALVTRGFSPSQVDWYVAAYDNNPVIPNGCVAKQYASNASYDTSVCDPTWLARVADETAQVLHIPEPMPNPTAPKGMLQVLLVRNPGAKVTLDNGAVIETGEICACDSGGAVNLGNDWPAVQSAYPNEPVIESASLLTRFAKISLH